MGDYYLELESEQTNIKNILLAVMANSYKLEHVDDNVVSLLRHTSVKMLFTIL